MSNDDKGSHSVMVIGMGIDLHDISLFGGKVQIFHEDLTNFCLWRCGT